MSKDKKVFMLLVTLFIVLTYFHAMVKEIVESPFNDFADYWVNTYLLKEGYNVWERDKQTQERSIEILRENNHVIDIVGTPIHSLGFFVFVLPFILLPLRLAALHWMALGHLFLFCSIWLIIKICKDKASLEDLFMVLFLVFAFWPIREQLHSGQPNFFILLFLTLSLFLIKKSQLLLSGLFLSLAIMFREYLVVIVLLFLWKRNWRILTGTILGLLLLKGLVIFIFGWIKEFSYWKYMVLTFGRQVHFSMENKSFTAAIYRIGKDLLNLPICFGIGLLGIFILIGKAFLWTRRKDIDLLLGFSLFLILAFLVSPWIHEQHYIALYPAIIISWFKLEQEKDLFLYGLFISAYLFLGLGYSLNRFPQFHSGILAIFTAGKLLGVVILFFLIGRLIQKAGLLKKSF